MCRYAVCRYAEDRGADFWVDNFGLKNLVAVFSWAQCYKRIFVRNLRIFEISYSIYPWRAFPD